jgi:PAS domain S-box-containing protein
VTAQLGLGVALSAIVVAEWWLLAQDGAHAIIGILVVVVASLVVARDMGRSRRAAARAVARMRWHERALEDFLENAHDLIQWVGGNGRFVYVNRSWRRVLGYGDFEVPALRVGDVIHAESLAAWTQACDRTASESGHDEPVRATLLARDGSHVMVEGHVQRSHEGDNVVRAILRDVTERNLAEAAKHESQVFLRAVLGAVPSLIMTVSPDGRILFVNRTVEGYTREDAIGASIFDFLEPGYHDAVSRALERAYTTREVTDFEAEGAGANGVISFYKTRVAPIEYAGEVKALALVSADITEERELELRRSREAAVSAALVHIGHVLIEPLEEGALLSRLTQATTEAFGCDASHTFLREADGAYRTVAGYGDTPEQWEVLRSTRVPELLVEPILRRLTAKGVFQIAADATPHDPALALAQRFGITAAVYVPLRRGAQLVGVHTIAFRGRRTPVDPWVEELAREVGDLVSLRLRGTS